MQTRWGLLAIGLLLPAVLVSPPDLAGQEGSEDPRFALGVQGNFVPIHGGDATVGFLSNYGVTAAFSFRTISRLWVGVTGTYTPRDDDPYHKVPGVVYLDGLLHIDLLPARYRSRLFLTAGGGILSYDAGERGECRIEDGCIQEGGPGSFTDGSVFAVVAGAGLSLPVSPRWAIVGDIRLHMRRKAGAVFGVGVERSW